MSALRHVEYCIAQQSAHAHLNAFSTPPAPALLRSLAQRIDSAPAPPTPSPLRGRLIALKANICSPVANNEPTTAGSRALEGHVSPVPSTVATLLSAAGALVAGKTTMDEFGMGSHSQTGASGPVLSHLTHGSPASGPLSAGGSSAGSAVAVATRQCWAALGTDTGGSARLPAAWTGTVGFKPSYGRVSRWGVVDYANSLDTVGVLARRVSAARAVFRALDRHDERDPTSLTPRTRARLDSRPWDGARALRVGVPLEWNVAGLQRDVRAAWTAALAALQARGHVLVPVSLPSTPLALAAYYILAPAEASSNLARYDGVRYGFRAPGPDEIASSPSAAEGLYSATRAAAFGPEVRRRVLLGTYTLSSDAVDNHFRQAQRVRRLVRQEFDAVFAAPHPLLDSAKVVAEEGVDVLLAPTAPSLPPRLDEVRAQPPVRAYAADALTVPASLAGLPAVSVPVGLASAGGRRTVGQDEDDVGEVESTVSTAGLQIVGQFGQDELVLDVGRLIEDLELDYNDNE